MTVPSLTEPISRRRILRLGVGLAATTLLAACGASTASPAASVAGGAASARPSGGSGTRVRIIGESPIGGSFDPPNLSVRVGDTVVWENTASIVHVVICDPDNPFDVEHILPAGAASFNSRTILPGGTFEHTFDVAGEYQYSCLQHTSDFGRVTVSA